MRCENRMRTSEGFGSMQAQNSVWRGRNVRLKGDGWKGRGDKVDEFKQYYTSLG